MLKTIELFASFSLYALLEILLLNEGCGDYYSVSVAFLSFTVSF
jgi:hypothetical protein